MPGLLRPVLQGRHDIRKTNETSMLQTTLDLPKSPLIPEITDGRPVYPE